jgi:hypothetical protein
MCNCGSGEYSEVYYDGHGIYLFRACEQCYLDKRNQFKDDIFEQYECEEPIEETF